MTKDEINALVFIVFVLNGRLWTSDLLLATLLKRMEKVDPDRATFEETLAVLKKAREDAEAETDMNKWLSSPPFPVPESLMKEFHSVAKNGFLAGLDCAYKALRESIPPSIDKGL